MSSALTGDWCLARLLCTVAAERETLARDTLGVIRSCFGIPVAERPEYRREGVCAVDGAYFPGPPRIVIALAESPRRRAFTALHELAHHLVRHDWGLFGLAPNRILEEEVCDRFAAEILLPTELSKRLLSRPIPTATEFAALYEQSYASRAVCARRVAAGLPRTGHAVVTLGTMTTYCASARTPFRSAFGLEQGEDSIFGVAVLDGTAGGLARLWYQEGVVSPVFQADAIFREDHVFAVFVEPDCVP
jgi:hypothetical protein